MTEPADPPRKVALAGAFLLAGTVLTMFIHWELSGESWGYWFLARLLADNGELASPGRSPLYGLYLNLFRWLDYPLCVDAEYLVTTLLMGAALTALVRPYTGLLPAVFAVLLWLPYIQQAEPPTQKLGLAVSACAVLLRRGPSPGAPRMSASYALLLLACLFRNTYSAMLLMFAAWDSRALLKSGGVPALRAALRPRAALLPVLGALLLMAVFRFAPRSHPWNNAWITSTVWFPLKGKTLLETSFLGHLNWKYAEDRYGGPVGVDFYTTHKEAFGDAGDSALRAVLANPKLVFSHIWRNARALPLIAIELTELRWINRGPRLIRALNPLILLVILLCALRLAASGPRPAEDGTRAPPGAEADPSLFIFVLGSALMTASTVLAWHKDRYVFPLVPVFILAAAFCARFLAARIPSRLKPSLRGAVAAAVLPLSLLLFSNVSAWSGALTDIAEDVSSGEVRVMRTRPRSVRAARGRLVELSRDCRGILALEHTYFTGLMPGPMDRVRDIWTLPPFSRPGEPYDPQLDPSGIDCVFVSKTLATGWGYATSYGLRYRLHIKPYAAALRGLGADLHEIPGYGHAVVLPGSPGTSAPPNTSAKVAQPQGG